MTVLVDYRILLVPFASFLIVSKRILIYTLISKYILEERRYSYEANI